MAHTFFGDCIKRISVAALLAAIAAPAVAQTAARVEVAFVQPEKFTDVGDGRPVTDKQRDSLLGQLRRHLERRGAPYVPEGGKLEISVTDVDMAGGFEPLRSPALGHVRIVRDIYPPRIVLNYKLTGAGGKVLGEGRRDLSGLAFMTDIENRGDLLRHEKKLLDDWLEREFTPSLTPQ